MKLHRTSQFPAADIFKYSAIPASGLISPLGKRTVSFHELPIIDQCFTGNRPTNIEARTPGQQGRTSHQLDLTTKGKADRLQPRRNWAAKLKWLFQMCCVKWSWRISETCLSSEEGLDLLLCNAWPHLFPTKVIPSHWAVPIHWPVCRWCQFTSREQHWHRGLHRTSLWMNLQFLQSWIWWRKFQSWSRCRQNHRQSKPKICHYQHWEWV